MALTNVKIIVNPAAVAGLLRGAGGPTDVFSRTKAVEMAAIARRIVGVKSGATKRSIRVTRSVSPAWNVKARSRAALVHHEGSRPHLMSNGPYSFVPGQGKHGYFSGKKIVVPTVNHPGTAPNPYLLRAAEILGLRIKSLHGL